MECEWDGRAGCCRGRDRGGLCLPFVSHSHRGGASSLHLQSPSCRRVRCERSLGNHGRVPFSAWADLASIVGMRSTCTANGRRCRARPMYSYKTDRQGRARGSACGRSVWEGVSDTWRCEQPSPGMHSMQPRHRFDRESSTSPSSTSAARPASVPTTQVWYRKVALCRARGAAAGVG